MITGVGTDIVEINRIQKSLEKFEDSFLERVFTPAEISAGKNRHMSAEFFAGRWAAKEAFAKALGCGIGEYCGFLDIQIDNLPTGQPEITVTGKAFEMMKSRHPQKIHLSISHEKHYATAVVILEK